MHIEKDTIFSEDYFNVHQIHHIQEFGKKKY